LRHHRRSIRLKNYNYSAEGAYSVTICTHNRDCTLGDVANGEMILSEIGRIADECWLAVPNDLPNVVLDEYQIMPNHVHGIVVIWDKDAKDLVGDGDSVRDLINQISPGDQIPPGKRNLPEISLGFAGAKFSRKIDWPLMKNPKQTLGKIVRHFKAKATKSIHDAAFYNFGWQGKFHDHIIRDEDDLKRVRRYIRNNPKRWSENGGKGIERA
jgi:putative transposase